jgi:hypothetical protein
MSVQNPVVQHRGEMLVAAAYNRPADLLEAPSLSPGAYLHGLGAGRVYAGEEL